MDANAESPQGHDSDPSQRNKNIDKAVETAVRIVNQRMSEPAGGRVFSSINVPLIYPEITSRPGEEHVPDEVLHGRIGADNRVMLNRLYGKTGARIEESRVVTHQTGTQIEEIVEVPVGDGFSFQEITVGERVGASGEIVPLRSFVDLQDKRK